jgi:hypothetical protein
MYQIQLPLSEDCLWWLCENVKTGRKGLVPRNFLTLYPQWCYIPHNFKPFELPSNPQALETLLKQNVKEEAKEEKPERRDSNATLDPCDNASEDQNGSCSPASSRAEDSPPPLPKPDFDSNVQISAHA